MKHALFILLLAPIGFCFSQNSSRKDSLLSALNTTNLDTQKISILDGLVEEVFFYNPTEALMYNEQRMELSKKIGFVLGEANSYAWRAYLEESMGHAQLAIDYNFKAIEKYEQISDFSSMSI